MFVKYEDKVDLINKVFKREPKKFTQLTSLKLKMSISEGTLLYGWGNATLGKLGLGQKVKDLKSHS